jgi:hypothetical protein
LQGTRTGIGTALRTARECRGISLEKASRDTRIHSQYLQALEHESFHALRADVYVRGFLRSYSSYLGLDAEKVITFYERRAPARPAPAPAPGAQDEERDLGAPRRRAHWYLVAAVALGLLVLFGAIGLLARTGTMPTSRRIPIASASSATPTDEVTIKVVAAHRAVKTFVVADGVRKFAKTLWYQQSRTFRAQGLLRVELRPGGAANLVVNGHKLGTAGATKAPYRASFTPQDFRDVPAVTPSASG